jgi:DNA-binding transcriptional regulator YhcF (GntR family)
MGNIDKLQPVRARPGEPLYLTVRRAVRSAVDSGVFVNGTRLPSTKALSEQLNVSLVTVHRALQELVGLGVLRRGQGRGTFVHEEYLERARHSMGLRFGLVFHAECSLADSYHSSILEGVRKGADEYGADLVLLHFGEDWRKECQGFLYVNPFADQLARPGNENAPRLSSAIAGPSGPGFASGPGTRHQCPSMVVGATFDHPGIGCVDTDNHNIARQAVEHLVSLGHKRIVYVGGGDHIANNADRYRGFLDACNEHRVQVDERDIDRGNGWKFDPEQEAQFRRMIRRPTSERPTAVFAAGYHYALGIYSIAHSMGLSIPGDLSVVGVDDPPSAEHLSPPMTTVRQPLIEMGRQAMRALFDMVGADHPMVQVTKLRGELVVRRSTSAPLAPSAARPSSPAPLVR